MKKVYIYHKFERFWHWTQALLILFFILTGFEIHGYYHLFGFKSAVNLHTKTAIIYIITYITIIAWLFFSGEWIQYFPKLRGLGKGLWSQIKFYLSGIFKGEEHPSPKTPVDKFNDLQRLTYFILLFFLLPLMIISGILYMNYSSFHANGFIYNLKYVAYFHSFMAFFFVAFVIGHVYLTTTGFKPLSAIKAMLTGWEEMSDHEAQIALRDYLKYYIKKASNNIMTANNQVDNETFYSVFEKIAEEIGVKAEELVQRLDKANIGYIKANTDGKFIDVNKTADELLTCHNPDYKNLSINKLFSEEENNIISILLEKTSSGKIGSGTELELNCQGKQIKLAVSLFPFKDANKISAIEIILIPLN